ncbi:imidazole glycerol phosphate synthase subunit HisH [Alienimonas californiensis]|uniref:Imidazole glycerol phosphate synthase subunit HisH n=1 Tax=Alienimonas californiensis TaxID=2527989 RepID=A0A517PD33_9PLAN|nr:imidazole glycerol phosphate synthase subunit HisH [Alienimonas californiensis]QDT17282.1 Imidazole glycerol phosphate synthase subunit HisH 1 [Alienimonas californiensis]
MIRIVDYGSGNLRSVQKAVQSLGFEATISARPEEFSKGDKLILPGQGAFGDCARGLAESGLREVVLDQIAADRPLLGVCVGLQLLFDVGREDGDHEGLGVLRGEVVKFDGPAFEGPDRAKIPLMGWCPLLSPASRSLEETPVLRGLGPNPHVYFVHSYHAAGVDPAVVAAEAEHGGRFVAAVHRGALTATQFHPEKSQAVGLQILRNFATL